MTDLLQIEDRDTGRSDEVGDQLGHPRLTTTRVARVIHRERCALLIAQFVLGGHP